MTGSDQSLRIPAQTHSMVDYLPDSHLPGSHHHYLPGSHLSQK